MGTLAHYWEANENKTEWTFFLKKGILFHNGKELTATDIKYTFSLLLHPDFEQFWLVENIHFIECLNRYTIRFHLYKPNELFLQFLSFPALSVIPSGSTSYIGTGPFKVQTYNPNYIALEANPSYFEGRPFVDRIEILNVPREYEKEILADHTSIFVNTGEGSNHIGDPSHKLIKGTYEGSTLFTFNLGKKTGPQQNLFFRKAVHKLIDRKKLIADLGPPRMIPAANFDINDSLEMTFEKVDDEEIRVLLQAAGYRGESVQLFTYDRHQPDAEWIKQEAANYGVSFHVTILGWNEILKQENINQADCILFEAVWGENELSKLELYQSGFSFLRQHLNQETAEFIDRNMTEIMAASRREDRSILFSEIESRLIETNALVFLVHKNIESTFHPSIKGVQLNTRGNVDFKTIWIKPDLTEKGK
ncbi:hypothetical protein JK635_21845 [Neobacillus sp. YIM B02564]|jgi:SgrR family transcriptional regulator|uniref:Solute-binding protein family 5 domain-containing protein n=1 Tax=Neobacillus paridis TaxID=2803862 RepID=A0ABS1TWY3_9BACI|nr:ABC transporter substrate-binding protein [Neobacillus paridis]MBL4954806.1 hypothetical protein [Neobacillus paridis]